MMKCKFCREEIPEDVKVCPLCGSAVYDEAASDESKRTEQGEVREENQYQYGTPNQNINYNPYNQQKPINGTLYLILSILATLLCCLPLGIAGIVFSSRINSQQRNGDYEGARSSAKMARIFLIISLVIGIIAGVMYVALGIKGMHNYNSNSSAISDITEDIEWTGEDEGEDGITGDLDGIEDKDVKPAQSVSKLGENWDSYTIQINDKVIALPCEYKELEEAGLTIDKSMGLDDGGIVSKGEYSIGYLADKNGNSMMVDFINPYDEEKKVEDCLIGGISVGDYDLENGGMTVTFPGNVQIGTSKDEVTGKYGETEDTYEGESLHIYTWTNSDLNYSTFEADFDPESGKLVQVFMKNYGF